MRDRTGARGKVANVHGRTERRGISCRCSQSLIVCLIGLSLTCCVGPFAAADEPGGKDYHQITPTLRWGGSLRARGEMKSNFQFGDDKIMNDENYLLTQLRINLKWVPLEWVTAFVEGQDARMLGEKDIDDKANPSIWADNLDLHQGWIEFRSGTEMPVPVKLRIGRQKLVKGVQRLIAPLEWVNTARVHDAIRVSLGDPEVRYWDVIVSRLVPVDPKDFNDWSESGNRFFDSDFHTVYYTDKKVIPKTVMDVYWMYREQNDFDDRVHTVGVRLDTVVAAWDFNCEVATQWGDFGGQDHGAWATHIECGRSWKDFHNLRLGFAYNFASGDGNANDGDHETFDNMYPLNHAYYGYMDFFAWQNMRNFEATLKLKPLKKLGVRLAYHAFWLDEEDTDSWYNAGGAAIRTAVGNADSYVGAETDLTLSYRVRKDLNLDLGYGHFWPGDYVDDTGKDDAADFGFVQLKWTF